MNRRNILIGLGVIGAGAAAGGAWWLSRDRSTAPMASGGAGQPAQPAILATAAGDMPLYEDDHILGQAAAPVTILEFASLTCPHCAAFHKDTLPEVKKEWIETGRARLVFRHFPLDKVALRAAAVADCIPGDGFFGFLGVLFANQAKWAHAEDPFQVIGQYAALAGLDKATYEACLNDDAKIDSILARQADGSKKYNIASTPSFVVNGTPVVGNQSYQEFSKVLEQAATKAS